MPDLFKCPKCFLVVVPSGPMRECPNCRNFKFGDNDTPIPTPQPVDMTGSGPEAKEMARVHAELEQASHTHILMYCISVLLSFACIPLLVGTDLFVRWMTLHPDSVFFSGVGKLIFSLPYVIPAIGSVYFPLFGFAVVAEWAFCRSHKYPVVIMLTAAFVLGMPFAALMFMLVDWERRTAARLTEYLDQGNASIIAYACIGVHLAVVLFFAAIALSLVIYWIKEFIDLIVTTRPDR